MAELVKGAPPRTVIHLAAQAGVRYSLENPFAYERANVAGHLSVLEACRHASVEHLVYASSSSVYGERSVEGAFHEDDPVLAPCSLYAATKRAGELMSASYAALYGLSQTGLRFFTVCRPQGRLDMAYWRFTQSILAGEPIEVFGGEGRMARDFTYIGDIVDGIMGVVDHPPQAGDHRLFNIGDSRPVGLLRMIEVLEGALGRPAVKVMRPNAARRCQRHLCRHQPPQRSMRVCAQGSARGGIAAFRRSVSRARRLISLPVRGAEDG